MKTSLLLLLSVLTLNPTMAQEKASPLQAFENLVGGTWKADGAWESGIPFKQKKKYKWGLSGKIIKAKTFGIIGEESKEFGLRSEGIRAWSKEASGVKFWEFNIYGNITMGTITIDGSDLYYHYTYDFGRGPTELTDAWIFKSKDRYEFIIGIFKNDKWQKKYLTTEMKRSK